MDSVFVADSDDVINVNLFHALQEAEQNFSVADVFDVRRGNVRTRKIKFIAEHVLQDAKKFVVALNFVACHKVGETFKK